MLRRLLNELYTGSDCRYYVFWDGKPKALGKEKIVKGKVKSFEIYPLGNFDDDDGLLNIKLNEIGYLGEPVEVVLFGPTAVQSIWRIESPNLEEAEWVIQNRDMIMPASIPEDDLIFDFYAIDLNDEKYLCTAFTKKSAIENMMADGGLKDMVNIKSIKPLLALGFEKFGPSQILGNSHDFPIKIPGVKIHLADAGDGYSLACRDLGPAIDSISINAAPTAFTGGVPTAGPVFFQEEPDLLGKSYGFALKKFGFILNTLLVISLLLVGINAVLAILESKQVEKLEELKYLKTNLANIERDIRQLEYKSEQITKIEGLRSHLLSGLDALAHFKPEKLWWRKLDYQAEQGLKIEGFSNGETEVARYYGDLSQSRYFQEVALGQLLKYDPPDNSQIPPKYRADTFKFTLNIKGL